MVIRRFTFVSCLFVMFFLDSNGFGAELSPTIRNALIDEVQQLSPLAITWNDMSTPEGQFTGDQEDLMKQLHINATTAEALFSKKTIQIAFQQGDVYYHYQQFRKNVPQANGDAYIDTEVSFDGTVIFTGNPRTTLAGMPSPPMITKKLLAKQSTNDQANLLFSDGYSESAGIIFPNNGARMKTSSCVSELLELMQQGCTLQGVETSSLEGHNVYHVTILVPNPERVLGDKMDLLMLDTQMRRLGQSSADINAAREGVRLMRTQPEKLLYGFYLDPVINYAVRRREETLMDGTILVQSNMSNFRQVDKRPLFLAQLCITDFYKYGVFFQRLATPVIRRKLEVTSISSLEIPKEQFELNYDIPGTLITDYAQDPPKVYAIPAPIADLDKAVEKALPLIAETSQQSPLIASSTNPLVWIVIVCVSLVVIMTIAIVLLKRKNMSDK